MAILNNNRIVAYMVSAQTYEAILGRLDDFHLAELIKARSSEVGVGIDLADI